MEADTQIETCSHSFVSLLMRIHCCAAFEAQMTRNYFPKGLLISSIRLHFVENYSDIMYCANVKHQLSPQ